jgi:hypothetical protein
VAAAEFEHARRTLAPDDPEFQLIASELAPVLGLAISH